MTNLLGSLETSLRDDRVLPGKADEGRPKVPEPKGMIVYDPDRPLYETRHVCVLLGEVSDAFHGFTEEEPPET